MSEIHDNIIKSYYVDLENLKIKFYTEFLENNIKENTEIEFCNSMAHLFRNELSGSIIFDIEIGELEDFINDNQLILENEKKYGWPFWYKNIDELLEILIKNKQNYYIISTSYGLYGWILAEKMDISIK